MKRRALHFALALGLALSVLTGSVLVGSAQNGDDIDDDEVLYFPWVANGTMINDPRDNFGETGPYYGSVTIQNLENAEVEIVWVNTADGYGDSATLSAWESITLTPDDLFDGDELDGAAIVVGAQFVDEEQDEDDDGARIAGVLKQASPMPPDGLARTTDDHETVSGYTALVEDDLAEEIVLPIAQVNNNWNTLLRITHLPSSLDDDSGETDITVSFNPAGGGVVLSETVENVELGETVTVDLLSLGPPGDWVGSATISAGDEDAELGAVAERVKNETNMLLMNMSKPTVDDDDDNGVSSTQYAPLLFRQYFSWNTGISLVDLSGEENDITITYYDTSGTEQDQEELTLAPNGMNFVYTRVPPGQQGEGFLGSAVIEADGPIYGAVDEVKYFGQDLDRNHAMSYMIVPQPAMTGQSLAMPLVQKGNVDAQDVVHGDTSGIHLFNPAESFVVVGISYLDEDGEEVFTRVESLNAKEGLTSYTIDLADVPEDFKGSAIIQVLEGNGSVVGASNNVNYDVQFDGSAAFNLMLTDQAGPPINEEEVDAVMNGEGS